MSLLICLVSTNPFDKPTEVYVDGYIEINHFWQMSDTSTRKINGIEVLHGSCVYDQIIIWKYNDYYSRFETFHWQMIKDGRIKDRLITFEEKEEERIKVLKIWESEHIKTAKANKASLNDFAIYYDSEWTGSQSLLNRPCFNHRTGKYEVLMKAYGDEYTIYKIVSNGFVETNTEFDPEGTSRQEQGRSSGQGRFKGYIKK